MLTNVHLQILQSAASRKHQNEWTTVQLGHLSDLTHEPSDRRVLDPDLIDHQNNLQSFEALPIRVCS